MEVSGQGFQKLFRLKTGGNTGKTAASGGGDAGHGIGKTANFRQFLTAQFFRLFAAGHQLVDSASAENIACTGGVDGFQIGKGKHQSAGVFVGEKYAFFAHGGQHQLDAEFFHQPPCAFFRCFIEKQADFLFADFDHIGVLHAPQHLFCGIVFIFRR